jgi:hypothetical protein
MDYEALVTAHVNPGPDVTIAAQAVTPATATQMGIFMFDRDGQIAAFEEKPNADRLHVIGRSIPDGAAVRVHDETRPSWPRWGSTCSRGPRCWIC